MNSLVPSRKAALALVAAAALVAAGLSTNSQVQAQTAFSVRAKLKPLVAHSSSATQTSYEGVRSAPATTLGSTGCSYSVAAHTTATQRASSAHRTAIAVEWRFSTAAQAKAAAQGIYNGTICSARKSGKTVSSSSGTISLDGKSINQWRLFEYYPGKTTAAAARTYHQSGNVLVLLHLLPGSRSTTYPTAAERDRARATSAELMRTVNANGYNWVVARP